MLGVIIREGKYSSRFSADAAVGERGGGGAGCAVGAAAHVTEQDYWRAASPGTVDAAAARIKELEQKVMELENKIKRFTFLTDQPKMNQFCSTDEEFCFLTRFPSKEMFMLFWESVAPSASRIIYWTKAQREAYETSSPHRKLPLIGCVYMQRFLPIRLNTIGLQIQAEVFMLTLFSCLMKIFVYMLTTSNPMQNDAHAWSSA